MSNLNEFKAESELGSPLTFLNASAGTGKTYSICKKLCYLFVDSNEENRIKPEEAAVITFTNNAARELKTRIQTFLTNEEEVADLKKSFGKSLNKEQFEKNRAYAIAHLNEASIGTIHHFCTEILGIVGTLADFDAGRTLTQDTSDLLEFTNNANLTKYSQSKSFARSFDSKSYQKTLEEAQGSFNRDMFFADLKGVFKPKEDKSSTESDSTEDEAKCTSIQPNSELLAWQRWTKDLAKLYGLLERTHSVMSNDSLLALTNEAVSSEPVVKLLQKRWKLVMVDEFQDTDINQWNIIKKAFLSSSNENSPVKVITVGDDKQSIYSFRGAEVENFRSARELAEKNNNKTYVLNINYRSDSCVVDAVNAITKELFDPKSVVDVRAHITDRRLLDGDLDGNPNSVNKGLFIRTSETEFKIKDIPDDVTHVINHLLKTYTIKEGQNEHRHIKPSDIAVLVNGKDKAREILSTLKDSRIPAVFTNTTSVFDEQAAKDWLDLLESLVSLSDHNLLKRVAIGPFGIFEVNDLMNDSALDEIITRWQEYKNHTQKGGFNLLWENIEAKSNFSQRVFTNWYGEDYYINALQVKNWLQKLWHENPSLNYLAEKLSMKIKAAAKNPRNAEDEEKLNIPTDESSVQIYTYHGSKGLQFPIVLLPYLAIQKRDDFNDSSNTRCLYAFSSSPNLQNCSVEELKQKKIEKESEENARIAYVAFTRAELLNVVWTNPLPEDNSSKEAKDLPPLGRALANAKSKLNSNTFELTDDVLNSGEDVSNDRARSSIPDELYAYKHIDASDLPELKYRTSYSSISANLKSDVMTSGGGNDDDEIEEISDASNGKNDENLINEIKTTSPNEEWFNKELTADTHPLVDLEAGKDFGTQIHSAFENLINVRRSNPSLSLDEACSYAAKQTLIEKNLNSKDHEPLSFEESHERLTQALKQVFSISLNGPFEGKSFVDINPQNIRAELEFDFNLAPNSKSMLCCWKEHVHSDELLDFAERLGNAISMKGILTGSIDVLLRDDQGDYFIADWKTNNLTRLFGKTEEIEDPDDTDSTITVLTPRRNDYRHEFVVKEMKDATYLLQALIYAVAVYRITGKVPKGVAYLFVRGMGDQPQNNTEDAPGVFTWAIPEDLVIETNTILEGDSSHE
jgi:exodeoxyribonuclease V beta chain